MITLALLRHRGQQRALVNGLLNGGGLAITTPGPGGNTADGAGCGSETAFLFRLVSGWPSLTRLTISISAPRCD